MTTNSDGKLTQKTPPHVHAGFDKDDVMIKTFIIMLLPAIAAVFTMGEMAIYHILVAVFTALGAHHIITYLEKKVTGTSDYKSPTSSYVAGLIVGLAMPIAGPVYMTFIVSALTVLVFKWGQGKLFSRKILNPAAGAKVLALVLITLFVFLTEDLETGMDTGMIFHSHHFSEGWVEMLTAEGFQESIAFYETDTLSAAESLIFSKDHGWIGGGSGIVVLISGLIAIKWVKIKWRISASLLAAVTALSIIIALITGGSIIDRIAFHVFTGSVIFLAFFMATEPQSTPLSETGQYLFGLGVGILTFVLQLLGVLGGSIIALVIFNIFSGYFDRIIWKSPFGHEGDKVER